MITSAAMRLLWLLAAATLVFDAPASGAAVHAGGYAQRADVRAFAHDTARETGIPYAVIERTLGEARYQPKIVALMDRPLVAPPRWFEYAPPFLDADRVAAGVAFFDANAPVLARAEAEFGVPAGIIVAIIGVETYWGRITGRYRVLDALATLAFDYPRRAAFFRGELKEFLVFTREQHIAPTSVQGSFAGAMGLPQFMPRSYRSYAVDYDGDGRIDLWQSPADTIGSVANFLARHDWARGQPVLLAASVDADGARGVAAAPRRRHQRAPRARRMAARRRESRPCRPPTSRPNPSACCCSRTAPMRRALWIACNNFYVITRYNKSRLYAAAVWRLAGAIAEARQRARDASTCATSARVEASVAAGSAAPSRSAAMIGCASDLPSSTPN